MFYARASTLLHPLPVTPFILCDINGQLSDLARYTTTVLGEGYAEIVERLVQLLYDFYLPPMHGVASRRSSKPILGSQPLAVPTLTEIQVSLSVSFPGFPHLHHGSHVRSWPQVR